MTDETSSKDEMPIGPRVDASPANRPERLRPFAAEPSHWRLSTPATHGDALYEGIRGRDRRPSCGSICLRDRFPIARLSISTCSASPLRKIRCSSRSWIRASGGAVGYAAYMRIEPVHRVIEVGSILYTPRLQQTTLATEAMYLMARHVFEDLGYRRYEWKCNALNAPSRRAALRLGFTFEGIFRQHMIVKGRNRDTAWFSMLDSEWPARKANFERWLDPSNFGADGRQKVCSSRTLITALARQQAKRALLSIPALRRPAPAIPVFRRTLEFNPQLAHFRGQSGCERATKRYTGEESAGNGFSWDQRFDGSRASGLRRLGVRFSNWRRVCSDSRLRPKSASTSGWLCAC